MEINLEKSNNNNVELNNSPSYNGNKKNQENDSKMEKEFISNSIESIKTVESEKDNITPERKENLEENINNINNDINKKNNVESLIDEEKNDNAKNINEENNKEVGTTNEKLENKEVIINTKEIKDLNSFVSERESENENLNNNNSLIKEKENNNIDHSSQEQSNIIKEENKDGNRGTDEIEVEIQSNAKNMNDIKKNIKENILEEKDEKKELRDEKNNEINGNNDENKLEEKFIKSNLLILENNVDLNNNNNGNKIEESNEKKDIIIEVGNEQNNQLSLKENFINKNSHTDENNSDNNNRKATSIENKIEPNKESVEVLINDNSKGIKGTEEKKIKMKDKKETIEVNEVKGGTKDNSNLIDDIKNESNIKLEKNNNDIENLIDDSTIQILQGNDKINISENNESKIKDDSDSDEEEISTNKDYFPKGIKNLGLNCYMDSLLQCLFNIPELRDDFIKKKFDKTKQPLSYYFSKVMKKLLYSDKSYIIPYKLKKKLGEINPLFKMNKAADSTDLLRTMIDSFITEASLSSNDEEEKEQEYVDKQNILKEIKKGKKKNIIYNLMNVHILTTYKCKNHHDIFSLNSEANINFSLKNIMKNKKEKNSNINLGDCFDNLVQTKNNNQFHCDKCQQIILGESSEKIFYPPKILTIILNRGKKKAFRGKVEFEQILDISDYIDSHNKNLDEISPYYRLICSCNHSGDSSPSGHYTATCFNKETNFYYFYNDMIVEQKKYFEWIGEPYILIYKQLNKSFFEDSREIKNEININYLNKNIVSDYKTENNKYINLLMDVFRFFQSYNKYYSVNIYKNNLFIWKIDMKEKNKVSLIIDFSNPPKYSLSSIIYYEKNRKPLENLEKDMKIDLEKEEPLDLFEKITIFLNYVSKEYSMVGNKCCNII